MNETMTEAEKVVLAIDPGRLKCGVAVVRKSAPQSEVLHRCVVETSQLGPLLKQLADKFTPQIIIIGNGTSSSQTMRTAEELKLAPILLVDEQSTTLLARKRYFEENPPRGLRRLIPTSLQTPPGAYDDYVAVILAQRYFGGV